VTGTAAQPYAEDATAITTSPDEARHRAPAFG
jgi:hypothetical protein